LATLGEGGSFRELFFASLVTRGLSLGLWALALSGLRNHVNGFDLKDLKGVGRKYPIILTSVIAAIFCLAGIPLLASFPMRLVVIEGLSLVAPQNAVLAILGSFGLLIAAFRTLSTMVTDTGNDPWLANEPRILVIFLMIGLFGLLLLGLFPNLLIQLLTDLPAVLGQFTP
jgi:NADH-quinone oxidoreductase subunit N